MYPMATVLSLRLLGERSREVPEPLFEGQGLPYKFRYGGGNKPVRYAKGQLCVEIRDAITRARVLPPRYMVVSNSNSKFSSFC